MGIGSLTEAPRWRHAGAAVRQEPRRALYRSGRLELVGADATQLSFAGRQEPLAPLFLCPLLLALSALPWVAPRPMDALRAATSGAFLAACCALAAWARPRRRRLHVVSRDAAASSASGPGTVVAQPGRLRWVLDAQHVPNSLAAAYTVALEPDEGGSYTVLESNDPERLLRQFSEVLRHWPGPVDCRWALPHGARPWSIDPRSGTGTRGEGVERAVVVVPLAHRPLVWCASIMAALVVTDLTFLVTTAARGVPEVHWLSVALALAFASCLIALALGLGTGGWRLGIGARVRREITLLRLRQERGNVRLESVRGVYALGLASAERWHVIVDSADGPLALPVPRRDAQAIARETERAIVRARSGDGPGR